VLGRSTAFVSTGSTPWQTAIQVLAAFAASGSSTIYLALRAPAQAANLDQVMCAS